jgi:hypothetical protein
MTATETFADKIETCRKGHPYTEENTRWVEVRGQRSRQCRQCDKDRAQAKRDRLRGDAPKFKKKHLAEECFRGHPLEGDNLYWYDTKWGKQRRCRACDEFRRLERIGQATTVQPTKTHCVNGHALEGDNLSFNTEGYAVCLACSLARTMKHKNANYDAVLEGNRRNRRRAKDETAEAAKIEILKIYAEDLTDDELILRLRAALPPAEE